MIKNILSLIIVSFMIFSAAQAVSAQPGAEPVSITVSHANGVASFIPGDEIDLPSGNVKISIAFKSTAGGEQNFVINAPFAKDILSSTGTIARSGNLWILKMYGLKGQSFTIDLVGDIKGSSYIEIIQGGDIPVKAAYVTLRSPDIIQNPEPDQDLLNMAERNLAKVQEMGFDTTLLKLRFENAKLKLKTNRMEAIEILNGIIQETQGMIDTRHKLELRLVDLKNRAIMNSRLDDASPLLLNAEKTIKENNFKAAEMYLDQLENMLGPSIIRDIVSNINYIFLVLFIVVAIIYYRRAKSNKGSGLGL